MRRGGHRLSPHASNVRNRDAPLAILLAIFAVPTVASFTPIIAHLLLNIVSDTASLSASHRLHRHAQPWAT